MFGRNNPTFDQHSRSQTPRTSQNHQSNPQNASCGMERIHAKEDVSHTYDQMCDSEDVVETNDNYVPLQSTGPLITSPGYVNGNKVTTLRDTGCTGIIVKKSLIDQKDFTGRIAKLELVDGTIIQCPVAKVFVDSPYFVGETDAMCLETPTVDLIIGNVPNATIDKNPYWCMSDKREVIQVAKAEQMSITDGNTGMKIDSDKLKTTQVADKSLEKLWHYAKEKKILRTRGDQPYHFEINRGMLYRVYKKRTGEIEKNIKQIVVPVTLRTYIMELAHRSQSQEELYYSGVG
jgi:hypothetical protein